jgi:hypothetical protein
MGGLFAVLAKAWPFLMLAMPIGFQGGMLSPPVDYELREDLWPEVREDGTLELRDGA